MTFIERLNQLCQENGISKRTLEKEAGLSIGSTSKWNEKNGKVPNATSQEKIANYFGVSIDYLMGRTDSMIERFNNTYDTEALADFTKKLEQGRIIPVLGKVVAGIPIEAVEEILDYEEIPAQLAKQGEFFALQIKGDSMSPRMQEGDVVIVRQQNDAESGDVVIAKVNGDDACCKKLIKHEEGITLQSFNPNYAPMYFSNKEIMEKPVVIIGKVVENRQKF